MGLGASPTHEAIKLLQQYKERNKKSNAPTGGTSAATDVAQAGASFAGFDYFVAAQQPTQSGPRPYLVRFG